MEEHIKIVENARNEFERKSKFLKEENTEIRKYQYEQDFLQQQLDQLEKTNEELKNIIKSSQMIENIKNFKEMEVAYKSNLKLCKYQEQQINKLATCIEQIKEICNNNDELQLDFNLVDCDKYKLGKHNLANKILQKISEVEDEM